MKQIKYTFDEPPGELVLNFNKNEDATEIFNECERAYFAWHGLEDPWSCLPEYIVMSLNDSGYIVKDWSCEYYD